MKTKNFFMFNDEKKYFDELSFEERGKVITAIFEFCNDEEISVSLEGKAKMLFMGIKKRLLSDRAKYEETRKKRA